MVTLVTITDADVVGTVATDDWLRDTLAMFPGVTRGVASRELVMAAREFYQKSYAWQHTIEQQDMLAGRNRYRLLIDNVHADVVSVLGVALNGTWIGAASGRPAPPTPDHDDSAERPASWYLGEAPDGVELYPDPTIADADALSFRVALTIKETATLLPRLASHLHYDAIMDGYLARVFAHPKKPYSSPTDVVMRRQKFNAAIGQWRAQAKLGYAPTQTWRFPLGWSK